MTTTPLMSLVLPTEGDSIDVWAPILATVFGLIDGHDHTPGKGGKVPMGGLNVNADVSWSSSGTSYAITDIRALDFSPQPASGMTALAGALFLNSADNNLYYRTTAGSNVQLTAGAALNIAGFSGGIGGDYSAAGALVDYDDATDTYRFRQQLGSSVRQFARMQSSDLDLFEYKASGVTPVPSFRVRLASPAALAASYALTFPGVLPASGKGMVQIDSTGEITASGAVWTIPAQLGAASSTATDTYSSGGGVGSASWQFNTSTNGVGFPVALPVGSIITAWTASFTKNSAVGTITAKLLSYIPATNTFAQIGATQSNAAVSPGFITLGQSGLSTTTVAGTQYFIHVNGGGTTGDSVYGGAVTT